MYAAVGLEVTFGHLSLAADFRVNANTQQAGDLLWRRPVCGFVQEYLQNTVICSRCGNVACTRTRTPIVRRGVEFNQILAINSFK